ncbi:Terpene cyclase [Mycena kentingensis (nom. inval.)]|nr:Terpene cyclase [Mycena kentingensis (nom. inval.)]
MPAPTTFKNGSRALWYPLVDLEKIWGQAPRKSPLQKQKQIAVDCTAWFAKYRPASASAVVAADAEDEMLRQINIGLLTTAIYPGAGYPQTRVCADFCAYLWLLDDLSDEQDVVEIERSGGLAEVVLGALRDPDGFASKARVAVLGKDMMRRFVRTAPVQVQQRFVATFEDFFQGVQAQAKIRSTGTLPTLKEYIEIRRQTSACKSCWAVCEYAYNIFLPEEVRFHPILAGLDEAANDLVANIPPGSLQDMYSYGRERARADLSHNMMHIVMVHQDLSLVAAAKFVGAMCIEAIERFHKLKAASQAVTESEWDSGTRREVARYVQALQDWITGILYWGFQQERYFGEDVKKVAETMRVYLV